MPEVIKLGPISQQSGFMTKMFLDLSHVLIYMEFTCFCTADCATAELESSKTNHVSLNHKVFTI